MSSKYKNKIQSSPTRRSKRNADIFVDGDDDEDKQVKKTSKLNTDSDLDYEAWQTKKGRK